MSWDAMLQHEAQTRYVPCQRCGSPLRVGDRVIEVRVVTETNASGVCTDRIGPRGALAHAQCEVVS